MSLLKRSIGLHEQASWMHPSSSIGELTLAHLCIRCVAIPTPHIILSSGFLSPMIVPIDVSLSHLFVFLPHHFSPCHPKCQHIFLVLIHCMSAQSQKGDDQFGLCLTSGLGMSHNKILKETKCEVLVD